MIIHVEYGDRNSIVELIETERNALRDCVKKEDQMHGFDVSDDKKYSTRNAMGYAKSSMY